MKRLLWVLSACILLMLALVSCQDDVDPEKCEHTYGEWTLTEAGCTEDGFKTRKCTACGNEEKLIEGTAIGHNFQNATCTLPSTCNRCGLTQGEANGHIISKTWTRSALGHWHAALCGCDVTDSFAEHFDGDDEDRLCDVCSYSLIPLVNLLENYKIVYKTDNFAAKTYVPKLISDIKMQTGVDIKGVGGSTSASRYEIIIGYVSQRTESQAARALLLDYENASYSAYSIKFYEDKLLIATSDDTALKCAIERICEYLKRGSFTVPKTIDEFVVFDTAKYKEDGTLTVYEKSMLDGLAALDSIKVNGEALEGFASDKTEYFGETNARDGYPEITAEAIIGGTNIEIVQPTYDNNGVATVKITSKDGKNTMTYTISIEMKDEYITPSEVITKDGKDGVVTIVLDDGNTRTGERVKELLAKYPEMTVTFAMITRKLAGFKLSDDGSAYLRDENGNFILTQTDAQKTAAAFWQELLSLYPNVEIANHSHTHAYAGEDDTRLYTAYDDNGNKYVYPAGSISAEVYGASQIIRELFGQESAGFIIPGINRTGEDWTINSWYPYIKSGSLVGGRLTSSSTNAASMVMMPNDFKNEQLRWNGRAFMIRYWNMAQKPEGGFYDQKITYDQAIAAGIKHTTDFIDAAVEKGGWACFCLHDIILEGQTGTHPIYMEQADALFSYVNELGKNGSAWVATYGDALTYYTEWATATTVATAHGERYIDLSLSCSESNEHFDMPLTVKVTVPDSWERCEYNYSGESTELTVQTAADGSKFVYADIVPETQGTINPIN